jgi:hypothetical protein
MSLLYKTKEVKEMLADLKLLAEDGFYINEIAEQMGYTYAKTQYYLSKFNIPYKKKAQVAPKDRLPHYIPTARLMIKKCLTVPCLKSTFNYIHQQVPKKDQDRLLDLLLDKQKAIRDAYNKETNQQNNDSSNRRRLSKTVSSFF